MRQFEDDKGMRTKPDAARRRIGVRTYDDETRALATEAVGADFTMRENVRWTEIGFWG